MTDAGRDVLEQGHEAAPRPRHDTRLAGIPAWLAAHRPARQRLGLALVVATLVVGGLVYAGRPSLPDAVATTVLTEQGRLAPVPARPPTGGQPVSHDLSAPHDPAHDSFIASAGHVLLFLQVRNDSPVPLRILAGGVPQEGVSDDVRAGGLTAGANPNQPIRPGATTEVFVRMAVDCTVATTGEASDQLYLAAEDAGRGAAPRRYEMVPLSGTGDLWDEARHAACGVLTPAEAVSVRLVPGSLRGRVGTDGARTISGVLEVHDRAGFAAALLRQPDPLAAGATLFWVPSSDPVVYVDGGSTVRTPVDWRVDDCGRASVLPPSAPTFAVRLPNGASSRLAADTVFGSFPRAWAAARAEACDGEL